MAFTELTHLLKLLCFLDWLKGSKAHAAATASPLPCALLSAGQFQLHGTGRGLETLIKIGRR